MKNTVSKDVKNVIGKPYDSKLEKNKIFIGNI